MSGNVGKCRESADIVGICWELSGRSRHQNIRMTELLLSKKRLRRIPTLVLRKKICTSIRDSKAQFRQVFLSPKIQVHRL